MNIEIDDILTLDNNKILVVLDDFNEVYFWARKLTFANSFVLKNDSISLFNDNLSIFILFISSGESPRE